MLQLMCRGKDVGRNFCMYFIVDKFCMRLCAKFCYMVVLWCCWLGSRKDIRPVKSEWWGTGVVICLEQGANDLHIIQLMSLPPHHLLLR